MTRAEFGEMLDDVVENVFYDHAPLRTPIPYIVFRFDYPDNFGADNLAYQRIASVTIEHYHSDYSNGDALKGVLDEAGIYWSLSSYYDEQNNIYIDTYTMEVTEDAEN